MKVEVLRSVVEALENNPEHLDMMSGVEKRKVRWFHPEDCGTACCIAGKTYLMYYEKSGVEIRDLRVGCSLNWKENIFPFAKGMLELTIKQASKLFHVSRWPDKFAAMYGRATTGAERVIALRGAVEDFIATNGWEEPTEITIRI